MTDPSPRQDLDVGKFFLGLFVTALGIVFLLDQLGYVEIHRQSVVRFWPVLLIVFGLSRLLSPSHHCGSGLAVLTLGVLFQLDTLYILDFDQTWPVLIVAVGVAIAWRALRETPSSVGTRENGHA